MLMHSVLAFAALVLTSSAASQMPWIPVAASPSVQEVEYISTDLSNVAIFTPGGARFGPYLARSEIAWPPYPAKYFDVDNNIRCVSFGFPGTVEYAIKRPISLGDSYKCLQSSFHVTNCYLSCRAAVIEVNTLIEVRRKRRALKAYIYVDTCRGVLAISQVANFSNGLPLDAPWLRGDIGILADADYPNCEYGSVENKGR